MNVFESPRAQTYVNEIVFSRRYLYLFFRREVTDKEETAQRSRRSGQVSSDFAADETAMPALKRSFTPFTPALLSVSTEL
jgi:hypothetical protein